MNKNIKYIFLLSVMFGLIIISVIINYFSKEDIIIKREKLEKLSSVQILDRKPKGINYSNVLKYLENQNYLKIKKIDSNYKDEKLFHIDLEFKGDRDKFNKFIENIKEEQNFYSIDSMQFKNEKGNIFICDLGINFYVDKWFLYIISIHKINVFANIRKFW